MKKSTKSSPFVRAIITLVPIVLIGVIFVLVFEIIFDIIEPISLILAGNQGNPHWFIHVISALILGFIILSLGFALQTRHGKKGFKWIELNVFMHLPFYSTINEIVKRFSGIKDMPFSRVVLIDPFDSGSYLTGFIVDDCRDQVLTVFVPTAPNPTNGNIYHVSANQVRYVNISPQEAMQTIIGLGTGTARLFDNIMDAPKDNDCRNTQSETETQTETGIAPAL